MAKTNNNLYNLLTGSITGTPENKWFVTEDRLNPEQSSFLEDIDINRQNIWIKGFAGTGKSILLVHAAKNILAQNPNSRLVIIVFTHSLIEMLNRALKELELNIPVITYYEFESYNQLYDYILCDEVQDLPPDIINKMYEQSAHLVVAGDSNQSIYPEDPKWRKKTVKPDEINSLIHGNEFPLTIIERLTESLFKAVKSLMKLNLAGSTIDLSKADAKITLCNATDSDSEVKYIVKQSTQVNERGYTAVILIPTHKKIIEFVNKALSSQGKPKWDSKVNNYGNTDFGDMNRHLKYHGLKMQYVGNKYGSFKDNTDYVVLMTYHSSKGLDFDYVYMPFCNNYLWISYNDDLAKTLFMVAMTRARMNLYITYTNSPHYYVSSFTQGLTTDNYKIINI